MASRKRKAIDLDTKYQILQAVDKNDQSKGIDVVLNNSFIYISAFAIYGAG
jgi:hypothetical protein